MNRGAKARIRRTGGENPSGLWRFNSAGGGADGGRTRAWTGPCRPQGEADEQGWQQRLEEHALLLVLRQEPARGAQADRRADGVHLRRMRRTVHGHHPRGEQVRAGQDARRHPDAEGNLQGPRRLRDRPVPGQARALGRGAQPLQAPQPRDQAFRRRAGEVEHPAGRPDRVGQDPAGADAGAHPRRALHHGRRHHADGSRLCRRGRREHHPQAAAGVRLQCRARPARHRLYRRDRQDFPQVGQSVDHPRRVGRGRAAGAAEDHGRHGRLRAAAGRPQASAAGIPAGGHDQHPVHLRRRLRRPRQDHLEPRQEHLDRLRGQGRRRRTSAAPAKSSARSSPRIC